MSGSSLLVVLGKNIGVGSSPEDIRQDPDHLSDESRMTVQAAGILYGASAGNMDLLFSGGHTAGETVPTEAEAMQSYFRLQYPEVPETSLSTEDESIDTRTNAIEVAKILAVGPNYDRIDLLSVFYHVSNAATLFRRLDVPIDRTYASDEIVGERSGEDRAFVHDWYGSERIAKEIQKERVRSVLLNTIDRRGRLLHAVTQRSRH